MLQRCKCEGQAPLPIYMNVPPQQEMGPGAKLPIGPCGVGTRAAFGLRALTDTNTCRFIGLTLCFDCPLREESAQRQPD